MFPGFGAMVVCSHTVVVHRRLVVVVRAVWRCRVVSLKGGVWDVGVEVGVEVVLNVRVADFWREKHDGMEVRWGNEGAWWSRLVLNKERVKKNAN